MKITPTNIIKLKKKELFVFGSNLAGNHAGGAAKFAFDNFGAEMGNNFGLQGQSFAIPTLDAAFGKLTISEIKGHIDGFSDIVQAHTKYHYLLTDIGCGIAGFTHDEIAPLFKDLYKLNLTNISFPQSFVDVLERGEVVRGFKGTDKNLACRGFQYEIDKTYEHTGRVSTCNSGFHFCENPLDVLSYYPVRNGNRFFEVEGSGKIDKENGDSKVACSKLKIGLEINLKSLTNAAVKFIFEKTKVGTVVSATSGYNANSATSGDNANSATSGYNAHSATSGYNANSATSGDNAHSATSGYNAHSATSGYNANSATSGYNAHSATSGYNAHSATSGYNAHSATSGYNAHSATSGYNANSATSGYNAHSATSGYNANSATSGDNANSATSGDNANSATSGYNAHSATSGKSTVSAAINAKSSAKADVGSWIVISEWIQDSDYNWNVKEVKAFLVDGKTIKADQYYTLKNGSPIETKGDF